MASQETDEVSICFVSPLIFYYLPSCDEEGVGGAEQQQYLISEYLINEGFNVSFVTQRYGGSGHVKERNGIDVYRSIPEKSGTRNALRKIVGVFLGLLRADADIYYVRDGTLFLVITAFYCKLFGKAYIFAAATDRDASPRLRNTGFVQKTLFKEATRLADRVVLQTRHQQELFSQNYNRDSIVIPNGLSLPPESEMIPHEQREFVLWVGRIDREQKHPERYLELAEELPEIQFLMIGTPEDEYYDEIRARAEKIENLDFVGYVPPEEIDDYYRRAFAVVNTSDYEGFPNVFLEAWRYATPVISLYFSLGGEIENNEVGFVSGDESTLRRDVEKVVEDTELRYHLGERSREYMKNQYSFEKLSEDYRSLFRSMDDSL